MIVFIGGGLSASRVDIQSDHGPARFTGNRRGFLLRDGREIPFMIATEPRDLKGVNATVYIWLQSTAAMRTSKEREFLVEAHRSYGASHNAEIPEGIYVCGSTTALEQGYNNSALWPIRWELSPRPT